MIEDEIKKVAREELYKDIWEISLAGVAKKYNVPYSRVFKLCREAEIPIPPSGYWTQLTFGKAIDKPALPFSETKELIISTNKTPKRSKNSNTIDETQVVPKDQQEKEEKPNKNKSKQSEEKTAIETTQKDSYIYYNKISGQKNIYNREKLYNEVWEKPVIEVALDYGVSDVAIHKICNYLNVPVPQEVIGLSFALERKLKKFLCLLQTGLQKHRGKEHLKL